MPSFPALKTRQAKIVRAAMAIADKLCKLFSIFARHVPHCDLIQIDVAFIKQPRHQHGAHITRSAGDEYTFNFVFVHIKFSKIV